MRLAIAPACLFSLACAASTPGPSVESEPVELKTRPFAPAAVADAPHQMIEVEVAGKSRSFLLDSGGGVTVISPALAAESGCVPSGRLTAHRMTNERVDMPTCVGLEIELGSVPLRPPVVGVFDLMKVIPKGWPQVEGMISLQTFEGRAVTFDLLGHRIVLETPASLAKRAQSGSELRIRVARPAAGAALDVFVAARAKNGRELWLILDTGSDAPLVLAPHAAQMLGAALEAPGSNPSVEVPIVGMGIVRATASVRDLIYDGNLGVPLLRPYVVTFDLEHQRAWAARRPGAAVGPP
jgi:hypothetical protein